jgi:hypothetical protein
VTESDTAASRAIGRQRGDGRCPSGKTNAIATNGAKSSGQLESSNIAASAPPVEPGRSKVA